MSFFPTQIFEEGTTEEKGENARLAAFVGAIAVGDLVKSTLGPKGMDKILQSASTGDIMVTNDGATILKSIALDNAAAKVLVNISKVQDDEVGDGTTSVAVLAAELLREAEKLVDKKIHPQTIIEGYRIASQAALKALEESAVDHSKSPEAFRKDLVAIARTTLSSKVLSQDRDHFSQLAVDAILRLKKSSDLSHIQIIKKAGGKLSDSYLDEGFILDKKIGVNQPKRLEKAKILVANTSMDTDKVKIFGARVKVGSTGKLAELEKAEKDKMKAKVEKIKAHGINCFINRQLIYNWPEQLFTDAGIMSIEHADFDGIERLALVTGGEIASTFDHPDQIKLGHCDLIEEVIIGEDTLIKFSGVAAGEACTIVLRGATEQLLDEAERSLHDALAVLSQTVIEPRTTLGGGCAEMVMAKAVEGAATRIEGKKQVAVSSFAIALRQLPTILADNAGLDSGELVARLRKAIYDGLTTYGLDLMTPGGGIADMREVGVVESYKLKKAVVSSASEAAELLLRVDDIIRAAPRRRERIRIAFSSSPCYSTIFSANIRSYPFILANHQTNIYLAINAEQATKQQQTNMMAMDSADDVISIESSDNDSDCRIVKVIPSPAKRGKNKSRWQNKLSSKTRGTLADWRGRDMTTRQLNEAVYEDRPSMSSASRRYTKHPSVGLMTTPCGLQGTNSKTDYMYLPDTGPNDTSTFTGAGSCAIQHVDLEDQHRSARSRSGSTATLDFSPERQSHKRSGEDAREIIGMLDEPSESTELVDTKDNTMLDASTVGVMPHDGDYPTSTPEASSEKPDAAILTMHPQNGQNISEGDSSFGPINAPLQPHKEASASGGQLRRAGRRLAWESVVNITAFKALPGPLFTRPKPILGTVTYKSMMEERAAQKTKERKGKHNNIASC
ncbi:hypothetical protein TrVFT333_007814 [Trichoderma virens FT-333]|nr:hypothetical protein TrVFT333_007814 [Trichoderma virens FT-333]